MTKPKQTTTKPDEAAVTVSELLKATKSYSGILAVAISCNTQKQKKEYGDGKYKDVRKLREDLVTTAAQISIIIEAIDSI